MEVTRLGRRHKAQPVVAGKNPRGETVYWVGPAGAAREAGPGTDFNALERGAVSVTPLQVDLTHANQIPLISKWIVK
jgi:5'-nucleotidase